MLAMLLDTRHTDNQPHCRRRAPSSSQERADTNKVRAEAAELRRRFNPRLVGFGIVGVRKVDPLSGDGNRNRFGGGDATAIDVEGRK